MAKIVLGGAPATFNRKVTFSLIEGGEGEIAVEYQYRTREQFAEFIAGVYPDLKNGPAIQNEPGIDVIAAAKRNIDSDVKHLLGAVRGWDLTDVFDADSARRLVNEFPAAVAAICYDYRLAITEGRLGN